VDGKIKADNHANFCSIYLFIYNQLQKDQITIFAVGDMQEIHTNTQIYTTRKGTKKKD